MHQAVAGRAGPPRLAFLNPTNATNTDANPGNGNGTLSAQGTFERRSSYGCLDGPFTTGVLANGTDTGSNFTIGARLSSYVAVLTFQLRSRRTRPASVRRALLSPR